MLPLHQRKFRPYFSSGIWGAYGGFIVDKTHLNDFQRLITKTHFFLGRPVLLADYYNSALYQYKFFSTTNNTWIIDVSSTTYEQYWKNTLNTKTRNQIRKSQKSELILRRAQATDAEGIFKLYLSFCSEKVISPKFDFNFFLSLCLAPESEIRIIVAEHNNTLIASAIFLISQSQVFYWQSYFNKNFSTLNPISGILNEIIQYSFKSKSILEVNFGSVPKHLDSLEFFKKNWGCVSRTYTTSAVII